MTFYQQNYHISVLELLLQMQAKSLLTLMIIMIINSINGKNNHTLNRQNNLHNNFNDEDKDDNNDDNNHNHNFKYISGIFGANWCLLFTLIPINHTLSRLPYIGLVPKTLASIGVKAME